MARHATTDPDVTLARAREALLEGREDVLRSIKEKSAKLLEELYQLVQMARKGADALEEGTILGGEKEEDQDEEELREFLEKFELKDGGTSISSLDLPELMVANEDEDAMDMEDEETISEEKEAEGSIRAESPQTKHEFDHDESDEEEEEESKDADANDAGSGDDMDIDEEQDQEISEVDAKEEGSSKARSPSPPVVPQKRKRRGTTTSAKDMELVSPTSAHESESSKSPSVETSSRQTRLRSSRKTASPPLPAVSEDDEPDELDAMSVASDKKGSRSVSRPVSAAVELDGKEDTAEVVSDVSTTHPSVILKAESDDVEGKDAQSRDASQVSQVVPATPSTPSQPSQDSTHITRQTSPARQQVPAVPTPIPTQSSPPRPPAPPILVRINVPPPTPQPTYNFLPSLASSRPEENIKQEATDDALKRATSASSATRLVPPYSKKSTNLTLPPLSMLPPEFNRKGKPQRSRKRDKERGESGKRDECIPLGMSKWAALLKVNPVYPKLSRACKCLSTRDWMTATTELQIIKSFERIETLRKEGRWSFRQIKKSRVSATQKSHWDYLMDEMKWMQTDFKEERRWKIAVACELALEVKEWHKAGSKEERIRLGITGAYRKPDRPDYVPLPDDDQVVIPNETHPDEDDEDSDEDVDMSDVERRDGQNGSGGTSDSEEAEAEEQRAVNDALDPGVILNEAIDDADRNTMAAAEANESTLPDVPSVPMKLEEMDNANALQLLNETAGDVSIQEPVGSIAEPANSTKKDILSKTYSVLKTLSANPTLGPIAEPSSSDIEENLKGVLPPMFSGEQIKRLRNSLASVADDELFVSVDQLLSISEEELFKSFTSGDDPSKIPEWDPCAIFTEIPAFGMMDVSTSDIVGGPSMSSADGKKRTDKRMDRDDPLKRIDETVYHRLYPASRFMSMKPTLVSALQPAKKWKEGRWVDLDESPVVSDVDAPLPPISNDITSSLFGNRRTISIGSGPLQPPIDRRGDPRLARHSNRVSNIAWSPAEDDLLRTVHERFPGNWRLVADGLNSSRIRTKADARLPMEVFSRWHEKFAPIRPTLQPTVLTPNVAPQFEEGSSSQVPPASSTMPPPPTPSASSITSTPQMTTRGIQRKATTAAQAAQNLTINTGSNTVENRKRKRHNVIHESMRKSATKRSRMRRQDEAKAQSSVMIAAHDTHNQFGTAQRRSPMELSIAKAERERAEMHRRQEIQRARQQQHQQQQQQHHHQVYLQQQQQQQAQQQQQQQTAGAQNAQQLQQQAQAQAAQQQAQSQAQPQAQLPVAQPQAQQSQAQLQVPQQQAAAVSQNVPQIRTQIGISQQQQQQRNASAAGMPMSPQTMAVAQQRLLLAQAQAVAAAQQNQANPSQLPAQLQNLQAGINGGSQHLQANFLGQSNSPTPTLNAQTSPPRSGATPVNAATAAIIANFQQQQQQQQQRPPSAQRSGATLPGTGVIPMTNGQVPISRQNNFNAQTALSYLQNMQNGLAGYSPEHIARLLNMTGFQQQLHNAQTQQQQQQAAQMQQQQQNQGNMSQFQQ